MKYFTDGNQIIVITEEDLLFGTYRKNTINSMTAKLKRDLVPEELSGIALRYLKEIIIDPESKSMVFKLGKSSEERLDFSTVDIRDSILTEILNLVRFEPINENKKVAYRKFQRRIAIFFLVIISIFFMDSSTTNGGITLGSKAIGMLLLAIKEAIRIELLIVLLFTLLIMILLLLDKDLGKAERTIKYVRN